MESSSGVSRFSACVEFQTADGKAVGKKPTI